MNGVIQLLLSLASCDETLKVIRRQEKRFLNDILNPKLRFPLTSRVSNSADKTFILLQAAISNISLADFSLKVN